MMRVIDKISIATREEIVVTLQLNITTMHQHKFLREDIQNIFLRSQMNSNKAGAELMYDRDEVLKIVNDRLRSINYGRVLQLDNLDVHLNRVWSIINHTGEG